MAQICRVLVGDVMFLSIFLCIASRENIKHKLVRFLEGIVNRFDAVGNHDLCQIGTVMESSGSESRDTLRNNEDRQRITVTEGIIADLCERIGQGHIRQGCAVPQRIIRKNGHTLGNFNTRQALALVEDLVTQVCQICREGDLRQIPALGDGVPSH